MTKEFDTKKVNKLFKKILTIFAKAEKDLPPANFAVIQDKYGGNVELTKRVNGLYFPTHLLALSIDSVGKMSMKKVNKEDYDKFQKFVRFLVFSYLFEKTLPTELGKKAILALNTILREEEEDNSMYY